MLEEIARYWHLDLDGLKTHPFDIEECLTLFESQEAETTDADRKLRLARASFALRQMIVRLRHRGLYRALIKVTNDGGHVSNYSEPILIR